MFVRWKHQPARRRREPAPAGERMLCAVLVEHHRVDGRSRQRVVRYLAAIRGGKLVYPPSTDRFWQDVDRTLADLAIDEAERQAIEGKVAATVPRPDPSILEQPRIEVTALTTAIAAMSAGGAARRRRAAPISGSSSPNLAPSGS